MAVIKASYFKECLEKGEPFRDRSNIPAEYIYSGEEVIENWKKYRICSAARYFGCVDFLDFSFSFKIFSMFLFKCCLLVIW